MFSNVFNRDLNQPVTICFKVGRKVHQFYSFSSLRLFASLVSFLKKEEKCFLLNQQKMVELKTCKGRKSDVLNEKKKKEMVPSIR